TRQLAGEVIAQETGKGKFNNYGEFLNAVRLAKTSMGRNIDPRLENAAKGNSQGVDADGGYLVSKEFINDFEASVYDESVFFNDTFKMAIGEGKNGVTLNLPKEGYSKVGTEEGVGVYGGAMAYWVPEAGDLTVSKPTFERNEWKLKKVAAVVFATSELLEDITAMSSFMSLSASTALAIKLDDAIMNGAGDANEPQGILNTNSLLTVAPADATKNITVDDIFKMWSQMRPRDRAGAKWYINSDLEPELMKLTLGNMPIYLPAGSIAGAPYATLLGRPVVPTDTTSEIGTKGDIVFANMQRYITITKGGIRQDVSIHVEFLTDQTAFRFIMRVDGKPMRAEKFKRFKGKGEFSPFIVLDTRSGGTSGAAAKLSAKDAKALAKAEADAKAKAEQEQQDQDGNQIP
ncbi:MAG: phage major capsid protein, partial [Firmicutes bacterium]|nr:phage major capsid protein [Bacillota bacterium]